MYCRATLRSRVLPCLHACLLVQLHTGVPLKRRGVARSARESGLRLRASLTLHSRLSGCPCVLTPHIGHRSSDIANGGASRSSQRAETESRVRSGSRGSRSHRAHWRAGDCGPVATRQCASASRRAPAPARGPRDTPGKRDRWDVWAESANNNRNSDFGLHIAPCTVHSFYYTIRSCSAVISLVVLHSTRCRSAIVTIQRYAQPGIYVRSALLRARLSVAAPVAGPALWPAARVRGAPTLRRASQAQVRRCPAATL